MPPSAVAEIVDVEVGRQAMEKLTGAHSQKNCGSATGAPLAARLTDRANAPRAIARAPHRLRRHVVTVAVDLDPPAPGAELREAGVVEDRAHARRATSSAAPRLPASGRVNVSSARRP